MSSPERSDRDNRSRQKEDSPREFGGPHLHEVAEGRRTFSPFGWKAGQTKRPSGESRRASTTLLQNGASSDAGSEFAAATGLSASARLRRRTEFARTLQKMANFAALAFFDLPFSRSYFELTSCPSTRT